MHLEKDKFEENGHEDFAASFSRELKNFFKIVLLPLLPVLLLLLLVSTCFVYVLPNEFGIKQVNIGFKSGIQTTVYETGLHFLMPMGMEVMHRFPAICRYLN